MMRRAGFMSRGVRNNLNIIVYNVSFLDVHFFICCDRIHSLDLLLYLNASLLFLHRLLVFFRFECGRAVLDRQPWFE